MRLAPETEAKERILNEIKGVAKSLGAEVKNPKWTSKDHLEIDVFADSKADFALFAAAVEPLAAIDFSRDLSEAPKFQTKEQLIAEARGYFNDERYWEAHEVLESVWRTLAGQEKLFVQGLILVCAAFVHHEKDEATIALGVLQRAARQLDYPTMSYFGVNNSHLRSAVKNILESRKFHVFQI